MKSKSFTQNWLLSFGRIILTSTFLILSFLVVGQQRDQIEMGADQSDSYLPILQGKRVGLIVNHTSTAGNMHLADLLLQKGIAVKTIFAPEHGFRGDSDAGEKINNSVDERTGIPIVSIYGTNRKPTVEQLSDLDILIYDIQDVGCRFYTYISSLHYVMEACAENGKKMIVLDRPNPNGDYFDGPILKPTFRSFVGVDPIPVVHGCTVGELAAMINGEGWLTGEVKCDLMVIPMKNYTHATPYDPPLKPSPNLPNYQSIRLYPSLCYFEATKVSVGRGTTFPFQVLGYPDSKFGEFNFTPMPLKGFDTSPLQNGKMCYGQDLSKIKKVPQLTLKYFMDWYKKFDRKEDFLSSEKRFNQLIGDDQIIQMIKEGKSEKEIRKYWEPQLESYRKIRSKYLLYKE